MPMPTHECGHMGMYSVQDEKEVHHTMGATYVPPVVHTLHPPSQPASAQTYNDTHFRRSEQNDIVYLHRHLLLLPATLHHCIVPYHIEIGGQSLRGRNRRPIADC